MHISRSRGRRTLMCPLATLANCTIAFPRSGQFIRSTFLVAHVSHRPGRRKDKIDTASSPTTCRSSRASALPFVVHMRSALLSRCGQTVRRQIILAPRRKPINSVGRISVGSRVHHGEPLTRENIGGALLGTRSSGRTRIPGE